MSVERILVPTDFSESAKEALDYAIEFAKPFSAEIHLLHSFAANPGSITPYSPGLPFDFVEAVRNAAKARLNEEAERVSAAGVEVHQHVKDDVPFEAIASMAEKLSADLIIMGTRGTTGLKHILLGSVAERTVRIAPCPVLTVGNH
jgi:nucleotide-binding universal stress UspA family protein